MFLIQMKKYSQFSVFYVVFAILIFTYLCEGNVVHNSPLLIYSTTKEIRYINISRTNKNKSTVLIPNINIISSFDFHYEMKKLCWTNNTDETIQCIEYDGFETKNKAVVLTGVFSTEGLACDWFTNKLYWTESNLHHIEVVSMVDKPNHKVLFWTDIDQPRAIALDPMMGLMFWTDWGEIPKIEKAGMNGDPSTRKIIVSEEIHWPNGLSLDYEAKCIYWVDGKLHFLDKIDYNGENRKRVRSQDLLYPYALTRYDSKFFWTDWQNSSIYTLENSTGELKKLLHSEKVPCDIRVWESKVQPNNHSHPCEENNGNCSHLCLLSPNPPGYTCACPIGVKLSNNLTCADGPQEILILARRADICVIYLDSPDYTYRHLNLTNLNYTIGVDYDPVEDFIYWTDDEIMKIQRAKLKGTQQTDIITHEIQHPDGIAIDWVARNLYWTDPGTDKIQVASLDGKYRNIIINEDLFEPRAIAVAPELGWLFWSDWNDKVPKIERANLDGTERTIIVSSNLTWPNGIALDLEKEKIYWCDAKTHTIEYANMDGSERIVLLTDLKHPFGFTLMGDYLYWTDWTRRTVERVHKETGILRETILDQISDVMGLKAVKVGQIQGVNPCSLNNGGCSYFCLYRHDKTYVCSCPIEYDLDKDGRTCFIPEAYLFYTSNTSVGRVGIGNGHVVTLPVRGIKSASSIDFDYINERIYWSDSKHKTIMRAYINGSDPQRIVELGLSAPEGVAIDWAALNIYWADPVANKIEVARLSGSSRRTLLWRNIEEPHSIALDPIKGYMYWSQWGQSNCIKKASMDGENPKTLIMNIKYATGLTLDYEMMRLYWIETATYSIVSTNYDGLNKTVIVSQLDNRPIGLSLYKDLLFWGNTIKDEVWRVNKRNRENAVKIAGLSEGVTDLSIFHASKQKGLNQCASNNGGCSHLCLALPSQNVEESDSYTCACPTHYTLQNNTCLSPKRFMIYSQRNLAMRLIPDSSDCPEAVLSIQGLKAVKYIDFDPVQQYLYWIEARTQSIKRAEVTGAHMAVFVAGGKNVRPFDLAVDALGRLLFWTCEASDVINVTRLENSSVMGVVLPKKDDKPRLIAIHPTKRLLFYTDVQPTGTQLIRIRMDGTHRISIKKAANITAIAVDVENDLLVWVQGQNITMSNIDGDDQHVLLSENKSRVTILVVHSGWLYWLDREINQLQRIELKTGQSRSPVLNHASHIVDLVSVIPTDRDHSCSQITIKKCSHLCIINGTSAVCACPDGLKLQTDRKSCAPLPNCGDDYFSCSVQSQSNKDCIPLAWRCDKQVDCHDGSDERDCPLCQSDQFRCKSSHCIEGNQLCDKVPQCPDGSDEETCCKEEEFRCPKTGACVEVSTLCDGVDDCADGADERKSVCQEANRYTSSQKSGSGIITIVILTTASVVIAFVALFYLLRRKCNVIETPHEQTEDLLNPLRAQAQLKAQKFRKGMPDVIGMSMLNGSQTSSYDRDHITGASSSTNGSSIGSYPRETLNPPPSPATTAASTRGSTPSSRYRPYRHYRSINQPPPPTPCSTDVCDESDYNYPTRSRYDGGPFPPPPTPRSHCHSESCPPSPSSRSSTYFSPLPPPPSPVTSPSRGYDS